jgi:transposase
MKAITSVSAIDWREGRRFRGWELHQQGWNQQQIADALGVTQGTVSKWLRCVHTHGVAALRHTKARGRTPRLTDAQLAQLPDLLNQGAEAFGFRGAVWTRARVAEVIKRSFGVVYHVAHISRLLKRIRWSRQQPIRRARQRNEPAIQHWREQDAPALKKKA